MNSVLFAHGRELSFHLASGRSIDEFSAIFNANPDSGYDRYDVISWLVEARPGGAAPTRLVSGPQRARYRRVRRMGNETFVIVEPQDILLSSTDSETPLRTFRVPFLLRGLGGTRRGDTYAFGVHVTHESKTYVMSRFEGDGWSAPQPAPGDLISLDGTDPDHLFAAGADGLLAFFDGHDWRQFRPELAGAFGGLTVVGPERAYACGWSGLVVELSPYGCTRIADVPGYFVDVGVLGDEVFVAGLPSFQEHSGHGLFRVRAGQLEPIECPGEPRSIDDQGGRLLITSVGAVFDTDDAATFRSVALADVVDDAALERLEQLTRRS